jgi:ribosome-interacting GTPase 1
MNVDITFHCDATEDELIDVLEGNRRYVPCIYVLNKVDDISMEDLKILEKFPHYVPISGINEWNFEELFETIWDYLDFIRVIFYIKIIEQVYTKPKGEIPDYGEPVILYRKKSTVEDFCNKIHRGIMTEFKYAYVWGSSVKHNPQKVGKDHVLFDEDIVQIIKK